MSNNLTWQQFRSREDRSREIGQRPVIAWLTGLSGAGKSSIAKFTDWMLAGDGRRCMILDGDNLRHGINRDLGFTAEERTENVRRTAEVARLMAETGLITIVALISPMRADRAMARKIIDNAPFLEVYVDTVLSICEKRDVKGLYAKARDGRIQVFTGITAPYEPPTNPDLTIQTENTSIFISAQILRARLLYESQI